MSEDVFEKMKKLPKEKQAEVSDFIEYLFNKYVIGHSVIPQKINANLEEYVSQDNANHGELIDAVEVMRRFRITKKTLSNYISSGKIPKTHYLVCFNGMKLFYCDKLLGIQSKL